MNWSKIALLAGLLFLTQIVLGFTEGILQAGSAAIWLPAGHAASFLACTAIFAFFAARQPVRPFAHASCGLLLQILIALGLSALLATWLGNTQWSSVALEWLVLVAALLVGTSIGVRQQSGVQKTVDG